MFNLQLSNLHALIRYVYIPKVKCMYMFYVTEKTDI